MTRVPLVNPWKDLFGPIKKHPAQINVPLGDTVPHVIESQSRDVQNVVLQATPFVILFSCLTGGLLFDCGRVASSVESRCLRLSGTVARVACRRRAPMTVSNAEPPPVRHAKQNDSSVFRFLFFGHEAHIAPSATKQPSRRGGWKAEARPCERTPRQGPRSEGCPRMAST